MHEDVQTLNLTSSVMPALFIHSLADDRGEVSDRHYGGLQNMVVTELCEGGSLLNALQYDDERPRSFGWCAA